MDLATVIVQLIIMNYYNNKGDDTVAKPRKQKDGSWIADVSWTDEKHDHNRKRKRFKYKKDADNWTLEMESQHAQGKNKAATKFIYLFDRYYNLRKKPFIRINTQYGWDLARKWFVDFFGEDQLIDMITADDYQEFMLSKSETNAKTTIRGVNQRLSEVFRYAIDEGYIIRNPANLVRIKGKNQRDIQYLNVEQIKTLLNYIFTSHIPRRSHSDKPIGSAWIVAAAIVTGCRLNELAGLTWNHIDVKNSVIHITRQLDRSGEFAELKTKSAKRDIPVPPSFIQRLEQIKDDGDTFVFYAQTNKPITVTTASYELKSLLKQCNISARGFHFHSLRHSHVALLLSQGIDIYTISKRLGHSRFDITLNTYAYLIDEKKDKDNKKIVNYLSELTD